MRSSVDPTSRARGRARGAIAWLVLCLAVGVVQASAHRIGLSSLGPSVPTWAPYVWHLTGAFGAWLALPVVVAAVRRAPGPRTAPLRFSAIHVAGYVAFVVVHAGSMFLLRAVATVWVSGASVQTASLDRWLWEAQSDLVLYTGLAALFSLLRESRRRQAAIVRASRLETELVATQLQVLTAQLEPHFVFNALNTIGAVMHEDVARAERLLAELGDMLRDSLGPAASAWPLASEIAYTRRYVELLRARFDERITVAWELAPGSDAVSVPRFCVQSLVENATKHNRRSSAPLRVRIMTSTSGDRLRLAVEDDGVGFARPPSLADRATGLGRLAETLRLLHGGRGELATSSTAAGGAVVSVCVPRGDA